MADGFFFQMAFKLLKTEILVPRCYSPYIYKWPLQADAGTNSDFTWCFNESKANIYTQMMWRHLESLFVPAWVI